MLAGILKPLTTAKPPKKEGEEDEEDLFGVRSINSNTEGARRWGTTLRRSRARARYRRGDRLMTREEEEEEEEEAAGWGTTGGREEAREEGAEEAQAQREEGGQGGGEGPHAGPHRAGGGYLTVRGGGDEGRERLQLGRERRDARACAEPLVILTGAAGPAGGRPPTKKEIAMAEQEALQAARRPQGRGGKKKKKKDPLEPPGLKVVPAPHQYEGNPFPAAATSPAWRTRPTARRCTRAWRPSSR